MISVNSRIGEGVGYTHWTKMPNSTVSSIPCGSIRGEFRCFRGQIFIPPVSKNCPIIGKFSNPDPGYKFFFFKVDRFDFIRKASSLIIKKPQIISLGRGKTIKAKICIQCWIHSHKHRKIGQRLTP